MTSAYVANVQSLKATSSACCRARINAPAHRTFLRFRVYLTFALCAQQVSVSNLFLYADGQDKLLMFIGTMGAAVHAW